MSRFKGFSVAEAFVALAIGGIVLGMAAPLISKQVQTQNFNDVQFRILKESLVPRGAVMFFDLESCPEGWNPVDNSWNGRFIRLSGAYDICDKDGMSGNKCKMVLKSIGASENKVGLLQEDATRRIKGRFPGQETGIDSLINQEWRRVVFDDPHNKYVEQLKKYNALEAPFDFLTVEEIDNGDFDLPKEYPNIYHGENPDWPAFEVKGKYMTYVDPAILELHGATVNRLWFNTTFDTKKVTPIAEENRPKSLTLLACKKK